MTLRSLIIKNALTPAEMKAQNTNFGLLKMITGNDNFFIAGNGMIKKKEENHRNQHQRIPQEHPQRILQNQTQREGNPTNQNIPNLNQSNNPADNLQVRPTPTFTLHPNFPQAPPQSRPSSLFANYAPTFPPFQFPPPVPSAPAPIPTANTVNSQNLLDFDFMPVAREEMRSGSPQSTRSSSPDQQSEGTSHAMHGHGQTQ